MKKFILLIGVVLVLAGCSVQAGQSNLTLQNLGPAPELENEIWINTDRPLRLADLRGQVVLVDMWTYG
jgi:hypothetical protein